MSSLATPERRPASPVARARGLAHADWLIVGILITARILLGLLQISRPGLQNDEVLFVNAATLRVPGDFLQYQVLGIPVMVFPYIGALKSWLYVPIFGLFGESPMSIRLPAELITTAGLVLLYPAVRTLVNRPVALLSLALLCFDNSLFWLTRDDVGPSALEFFLKCAGLFCAARLSRSGRLRWLALLVLTLGLGVFNKLNFIWVVNAVALVSIGPLLASRARLRRRPAAAVLWIGGLAVIYAAFGTYYFSQHIGLINAAQHHGPVLSHTWPRWVAGTEELLSGSWFYSYALAGMAPRLVVAYALFALFIVGAIASLLPGRRPSSPVATIALITVLVTLQMLVTYEATAGWHYISIYPFIFITCSYGVWWLTQSIRLSRRNGMVLVTAVAVAFVAYNGVLMAKYFDQLRREPRSSAWSPAIYRLSDYLRRQPGTVIAVDWGIQPSLFALDPNRRWVNDAFGFNRSAPAQLHQTAAWLAGVPGRKLIVSYTPQDETFPHVDANLAVAERGHLHRLTTIRDAAGAPVYYVYAYH
jgi:4-amino-4-deoxy-L-arabinose transferase-like glycosyltransferase